MSEPECVGCGETVDGMSLLPFKDGTHRWVCSGCEADLWDENGTVLVE